MLMLTCPIGYFDESIYSFRDRTGRKARFTKGLPFNADEDLYRAAQRLDEKGHKLGCRCARISAVTPISETVRYVLVELEVPGKKCYEELKSALIAVSFGPGYDLAWHDPQPDSNSNALFLDMVKSLRDETAKRQDIVFGGLPTRQHHRTFDRLTFQVPDGFFERSIIRLRRSDQGVIIASTVHETLRPKEESEGLSGLVIEREDAATGAKQVFISSPNQIKPAYHQQKLVNGIVVDVRAIGNGSQLVKDAETVFQSVR